MMGGQISWETEVEQGLIRQVHISDGAAHVNHGAAGRYCTAAGG